MTTETETGTTRSVAEGWFRALTTGDVQTALTYLAPDVEFVNYTPVPGYNDAMAWIGTHRGREAVLRSIEVFVGSARCCPRRCWPWSWRVRSDRRDPRAVPGPRPGGSSRSSSSSG